jgi:hypothetical protein
LDATEYKSLEFDAPARDQKVAVTVIASGSPVDVYLVLQKDQAAAEKALTLQKHLGIALARKEQTENATLEAIIPARNAFAVLISGARKACEVTVKVTGR